MEINYTEMIKKIEELEEKYCWANGYGDYTVGVRFEDKERQVGDKVGNSRHNIGREDEREFPDYNSEEYEEMFELDGASAWSIHHIIEELKREPIYATNHCYFIIGSNSVNEGDALDDGEVVIEDAEVAYILF